MMAIRDWASRAAIKLISTSRTSPTLSGRIHWISSSPIPARVTSNDRQQVAGYPLDSGRQRPGAEDSQDAVLEEVKTLFRDRQPPQGEAVTKENRQERQDLATVEGMPAEDQGPAQDKDEADGHQAAQPFPCDLPQQGRQGAHLSGCPVDCQDIGYGEESGAVIA